MSAIDTLLKSSPNISSPLDEVNKPIHQIYNIDGAERDQSVAKNFLKSFPEDFVRGIGLGPLLDLPSAVRGAYQEGAVPGISDILGGVKETAQGLSQGALNVIGSPAVGAVEELTGQRGLKTETPFGTFESPTSEIEKLIQEGYSPTEAFGGMVANKAASAGMFVGLGETPRLIGERFPMREVATPKTENMISETMIPKKLESLAQEMRNYKSVEEFVNTHYPSKEAFAPSYEYSPSSVSNPGGGFADRKIIGMRSLDTPLLAKNVLSDLEKGIKTADTELFKKELSDRGIHSIEDIKRWAQMPENPELNLMKGGDIKGPEDIKSAFTDFYNQVTRRANTIPRESSTIKLTSGIDPGLDKLIESDIKPVGRGIAESAKEIKDKLSPQYASPEATAAADKVRNAKAVLANSADVERLQYKDVEKNFSKFSSDENIKNISDYERTGKFSHAPKLGYSEFFRKSTDAAHEILRNVYKDHVGYVDNYVRRQYEYGSKADETAALNYFQEKYSRFATNKSPLKSRVYDIPIDEALKDMKARGINVKPVTTNPETLRQWTVANARHAQVFEDLRNLANTTKDPNIMRVLKNATSQGLVNSPTYKGIQSLNNAINQIQLGLSAFHLTGTGINAGISDMALGARKLGRGELLEGGKAVGRGLVPGYSFSRDLNVGRKVINALKSGNPEAMKVLEQKINPGGARLRAESQYYNRIYENMMRAFGEGNLIGGSLRIPGAVIQKISEPLMNYAIPRVKIGAYLDLVADIDKRLPDATQAVKNREYAKAWDSIDNRFGQFTYDNLMMNKVATDLSRLAVRSVGWNLGTIRELGGGITDIARGKITDRALYTVTLPIYVGMIGAVYQYIHTGHGPQEIKDYFYPKNGLKTASGQDDRVSLPTYMKDVFAYAKSPVSTLTHKASPILSLAFELGSNRDYFGDMIRNPDDPASTQLQQTGMHILSSLKPFSFQTLGKQRGASPLQKGEAFAGFVKAPANIINPNYQPAPHAPQTPEQKSEADLVRQAKEEIKRGDMTTFNILKKSGYFNTGNPRHTASKEHYFIQNAKMSPQQRENNYQKYLERKARY